jgi:hypothetical protein
VYAYAVLPREGVQCQRLRSTYNNFLLDGIDNNPAPRRQGYSTGGAPFSRHHQFKGSPATTAPVRPRGGAVVNVVMRSGTNQFHGTGMSSCAIPS